MRPHTSYLVCATPRSGSFLLCEALKTSGIAGRPEEYFWRDDEPFWKNRWGVSFYADYVAHAIEEGTTPNGVFGAKLMWAYFADDVAPKLRGIPTYRDLPLCNLLPAVFPNLRYLYITRQDKVRQAVSHLKAIQTNVWAVSAGEVPTPAREPTYDFAALDHLVRELTDQDAAWRRYFADCGVAPLRVVYEELAREYEGTRDAVLAYLGLVVPPAHVFAPRRLRRQADATSDAWVARYLREKRG
jgi:LPS sulfotransferase NodH